MTHLFTGSEIELLNGNPFDPAKPDHRQIDLETVAWALSGVCRYGAHCRPRLYVAEHAVLVSLKLGRLGAPLRIQMADLHHDDGEVLDGVGDVQRPAKPLLDSEYRRRAREIDRCVWRALAWPDKAADPLWHTQDFRDPLLKRVDHEWAIRFEARHIMRSRGEGWEQTRPESGGLPAISDHDEDLLWCWTPDEAYTAYLQRHRELERALTRLAVAA